MGKYKLTITPVENVYEVKLYKRRWFLFIPYWSKYKDTVYDQLPYGANVRHLQQIWNIPDHLIIYLNP